MTAVPTSSSRRLTTYVAAVLVPAAAWWALLGWDTSYRTGADGNQHGPYSTWQVVVLVVVLALQAVWLGARRAVVDGAALAAVTLAVCFGFTATVVRPDGTGLWVVGALFTLIGTFAGVTLVSLVARSVLDGMGRRPRPSR